MEWHISVPSTGCFGSVDLQIDHNRFLPAAHDNAFADFICKRIDLLMRHKRGNVNEVARPRIVAELKVITPSHPSTSPNYVKDRLQFTMMMRPGLCIGLHDDDTCPKLTGSRPGMGNRCSPRHTRSLRSIRIQLSRSNDLDAVVLPIHAPHYVNQNGKAPVVGYRRLG